MGEGWGWGWRHGGGRGGERGTPRAGTPPPPTPPPHPLSGGPWLRGEGCDGASCTLVQGLTLVPRTSTAPFALPVLHAPRASPSLLHILVQMHKPRLFARPSCKLLPFARSSCKARPLCSPAPRAGPAPCPPPHWLLAPYHLHIPALPTRGGVWDWAPPSSFAFRHPIGWLCGDVTPIGRRGRGQRREGLARASCLARAVAFARASCPSHTYPHPRRAHTRDEPDTLPRSHDPPSVARGSCTTAEPCMTPPSHATPPSCA